MPANSKKEIIICADDFGISPGVSKGILELAEKEKISATSVMVNFDDWKQEAKRLIEFDERIDIGLHFTLTGANPLSKPDKITSLINSDGSFLTLGKFIKKCILKNLDAEDVKREFLKQFDSFVDYFGFAPRYIDGHHNVHQYNVVNKALLEVFREKRHIHKFYVRNTAVPFQKAFRQGSNFFKAYSISLFGNPYKNLLEKIGIPTNSSFMGVYDWKQPELFSKNFKRFVRYSSFKNGIIMTHPGLPDDSLKKRDVYNDGRIQEFDLLKNIDFNELFESHNIVLSKFKFEEE
jgi:predicted glycoside hydrolase/deacetylase ChbG (UPF0249 family)